jgi:hypothetical protein
MEDRRQHGGIEPGITFEDWFPRGQAVGSWPGPWLIVNEPEASPGWEEQMFGRGSWHVYAFTGDETPPAFDNLMFGCLSAAPSMDDGILEAHRRGHGGPWLDIPDEVPWDLLSTVRWLVAQERERGAGL